MTTQPPPQSDGADRPPVFGTWGRMYGVVLFFLALLVAFFYLFGRAFS